MEEQRKDLEKIYDMAHVNIMAFNREQIRQRPCMLQSHQRPSNSDCLRQVAGDEEEPIDSEIALISSFQKYTKDFQKKA